MAQLYGFSALRSPYDLSTAAHKPTQTDLLPRRRAFVAAERTSAAAERGAMHLTTPGLSAHTMRTGYAGWCKADADSQQVALFF